MRHNKENDRKCPICDVNIHYDNRVSFRSAVRNNTDCKKCSALKRGPKSEEHKKKISQTLTGRHISDDIKKKIKISMVEKWKNDVEYRNKLFGSHDGEKNGMFGKHHNMEMRKIISEITKERMSSLEIKEKMKKIWASNEFKEKISKIHKGKIVSEESKNKMRDAVIRRIKKYGIHSRNFNPKACENIDEYGKKNGYNFQHALNGGEINICGYLVDGYDKEKNIVIEIDEPRHFLLNGNLRKKDIKRQNEIEEHLKCKFIRLPFIKINKEIL